MVSPHLLHLEASYSYRTYGGVYEGTLTKEKAIQQARKYAKEMWGERPTFVIEPSGKKAGTWTHMVWAKGPGRELENNQSELVIVWFSEMQPDSDRVLATVDWEKYAENSVLM